MVIFDSDGSILIQDTSTPSFHRLKKLNKTRALILSFYFCRLKKLNKSKDLLNELNENESESGH